MTDQHRGQTRRMPRPEPPTHLMGRAKGPPGRAPRTDPTERSVTPVPPPAEPAPVESAAARDDVAAPGAIDGRGRPRGIPPGPTVVTARRRSDADYGRTASSCSDWSSSASACGSSPSTPWGMTCRTSAGASSGRVVLIAIGVLVVLGSMRRGSR